MLDVFRRHSLNIESIFSEAISTSKHHIQYNKEIVLFWIVYNILNSHITDTNCVPIQILLSSHSFVFIFCKIQT